MEGLWLGLDVGTQGTKGLVLDLEAGRVLARTSESYGLLPGLAPGAAEQHPETWWQALVHVTQQLMNAPGVDPARVRGLGVSGQQHGLVPLDASGNVIRAAKLWCDTETAPQAQTLSERFGHQVPAGFTAPKLLWLKEREPENFAQLQAFALPHDWVNFRLTGRLATEAGDASGTGIFNPQTREFSRELAEAIDTRLQTMLPEVLEAHEPLGRLLPAVADELQLPHDVLVSPGGGDNMMSAIGSGATEAGVVVCSLGTSGTLFTQAHVPVIDPEGIVAPFCDSTGAWLPLLCVMNLTGVLEELSRCFALDHAELTQRATKTEPGAGGLLFLPYLAGERTPNLPQATGTLLGLRAGSLDPGMLYRAALEGTAANLAWGLDRLRSVYPPADGQAGGPVNAVRLVGGGSANTLWCEILAASFGLPVQCLRERESAALGAALQAAWVAARLEDSGASLTDMGRAVLHFEGPPLIPTEHSVGIYRDLGSRFRAAVRGTYDLP